MEHAPEKQLKDRSPRSAPTAEPEAPPVLSPENLGLLRSYLDRLLIEQGLASNTLTAYRSDLHGFLAFLGEHALELRECSEQGIFLYIVHIRRRGLSGRSLARHFSALRGFFAFLRKRG